MVTADVNAFAPSGVFDRVMSIEMFEHMRNWQGLLERVAGWLDPDGGKAFVHVFSHRSLPYLFEGTWAAERFFTAGLMPSHDLMLRFQRDLVVADQWIVPGGHYARTLDAWLANLDARSDEALAVLRSSGRSEREARRLLGTWRLFLISTEVIWGYRRAEPVGGQPLPARAAFSLTSFGRLSGVSANVNDGHRREDVGARGGWAGCRRGSWDKSIVWRYLSPKTPCKASYSRSSPPLPSSLLTCADTR